MILSRNNIVWAKVKTTVLTKIVTSWLLHHSSYEQSLPPGLHSCSYHHDLQYGNSFMMLFQFLVFFLCMDIFMLSVSAFIHHWKYGETPSYSQPLLMTILSHYLIEDTVEEENHLKYILFHCCNLSSIILNGKWC